MLSEDCTFESLGEALQVFTFTALGYVLIKAFANRAQLRQNGPELRATESTTTVPIAQSVIQTGESPITRWTRLRCDNNAHVTQLKLQKPVPVASGALPMTLLVDLAASLATFVDIAELSRLSTASRCSRDRFWYQHQVWAELFIARGWELNDVAADRFREMYFHISGGRPRALLAQARNGSGQASEILEEVSRMLRGLMPRDGRSALDCVLEAAADAIWAHEVSNDRAACAVKTFLQVAKRRDDLLSPCQLEGLDLLAVWKLRVVLPATEADATGCGQDVGDGQRNDEGYEHTGS